MKQQQETQPLYVRLPSRVHRTLKVRAATDGLSVQAWVTQLLTHALAGLDKLQPSALAVLKRKGGAK